MKINGKNDQIELCTSRPCVSSVRNVAMKANAVTDELIEAVFSVT